MCDFCRPFEDSMSITAHEHLQALHDHLYFDGVKPGILEILSGSLQWNDSIECTLRCVHCKQWFEFVFAKFLGRFGPIATPPRVGR